jgi:hypothetical protein
MAHSAIMRKWKILFTLNGLRTETVIAAPTQVQALLIAKAMLPGATGLNAIELH